MYILWAKRTQWLKPTLALALIFLYSCIFAILLFFCLIVWNNFLMVWKCLSRSSDQTKDFTSRRCLQYPPFTRALPETSLLLFDSLDLFNVFHRIICSWSFHVMVCSVISFQLPCLCCNIPGPGQTSTNTILLWVFRWILLQVRFSIFNILGENCFAKVQLREKFRGRLIHLCGRDGIFSSWQGQKDPRCFPSYFPWHENLMEDWTGNKRRFEDIIVEEDKGGGKSQHGSKIQEFLGHFFWNQVSAE